MLTIQACNWFGGEAVSLAVPHRGQERFKAAGYAEVKTNATHVGGVVRQHGLLSFTLVFQAGKSYKGFTPFFFLLFLGHAVPLFQPETTYEIFRRVINNRDIATGKVTLDGANKMEYSSKGPANALGYRQKLPPMPKTICYLLSMITTCSTAEEQRIRTGQARIRDYIVT